MAEFDVTELLADIRARGSLPSADLRFTDAKLLAAATRELQDAIAPLLVEVQAERGVYLSDVAVTAGVATYRLPTRAIAGRWQSLGWKGSGDTAYTRLRQVSGSAYYLQNDTDRGVPYGFIVRDYSVTLVPTPSTAGVLRLPYYMRPNTLVATSACAVVGAVDLGTNTITVDPPGSVPVTFGGVPLDVVRSTPGFETLVQGVIGTVAGDDIQMASDTGLSDVAVGDYVCLAGQSAVAQCPVEVRGLLAVRAARRALKSVNESNLAAMLDADVEEMTATARALLSPRADQEPQEFGDARQGLLRGLV